MREQSEASGRAQSRGRKQTEHGQVICKRVGTSRGQRTERAEWEERELNRNL